MLFIADAGKPSSTEVLLLAQYPITVMTNSFVLQVAATATIYTPDSQQLLATLLHHLGWAVETELVPAQAQIPSLQSLIAGVALACRDLAIRLLALRRAGFSGTQAVRLGRDAQLAAAQLGRVDVTHPASEAVDALHAANAIVYGVEAA